MIDENSEGNESMKLAVIQNFVYRDKAETLKEVQSMITAAADAGAEMAVLPEMFCCPYEMDNIALSAEAADGYISNALSEMASENHMVIVGGSIPELDDGRLFNTCFVFNEFGEKIARHRKKHLYDVNIKGGQHFKESATFAAGDSVTIFDVLGHRFGVAICYDVRFVEDFRKMALMGAEAVFVPASFNMTTGPVHWELTFRARAVDNQYYTIGVAPARDETSQYVSYSNSIVCDPWGRVLVSAGTEPVMKICDIDFEEVKRVREQLPILK